MRTILISLLGLLTFSAFAAPTIVISNKTDEAYQLIWYIDAPAQHEVIRYQQTIPAHAQNVAVNNGVVYTTTDKTDLSKQPVTVSVQAYIKGSQSQFADNTIALSLFQGNQMIQSSTFQLGINLQNDGISVFVKSDK